MVNTNKPNGSSHADPSAPPTTATHNKQSLLKNATTTTSPIRQKPSISSSTASIISNTIAAMNNAVANHATATSATKATSAAATATVHKSSTPQALPTIKEKELREKAGEELDCLTMSTSFVPVKTKARPHRNPCQCNWGDICCQLQRFFADEKHPLAGFVEVRYNSNSCGFLNFWDAAINLLQIPKSTQDDFAQKYELSKNDSNVRCPQIYIAKIHFPVELVQNHDVHKSWLSPLTKEQVEEWGCYGDLKPPYGLFQYNTDLGKGLSKRGQKIYGGKTLIRQAPCVSRTTITEYAATIQNAAEIRQKRTIEEWEAIISKKDAEYSELKSENRNLKAEVEKLRAVLDEKDVKIGAAKKDSQKYRVRARRAQSKLEEAKAEEEHLKKKMRIDEAREPPVEVEVQTDPTNPIHMPTIHTTAFNMPAELVDQHKEAYYQKLLNCSVADLETHTPSINQFMLKSKAQLAEMIHVVQYWNTGADGLNAGAFHTKYKNWYGRLKRLPGVHIRLIPDETGEENTFTTVVCNRSKDGSESRPYLPIDSLFDALFEIHAVELSHHGIMHAKVKADERYANISEAHVRAFIETCPVCMMKKDGSDSFSSDDESM